MSTIQSTLKLSRLLASTGYLKYAGLLPTIVKELDYGVSVDREGYRGTSEIDLGVGVDKYFGQLQKSDKDLATTADNMFLVFTPEDIADCVSKMRYVDTRCRDLCSEANFLNNKDWCLTNCEVRAEDVNIPSQCLRYIYHFIRTQTHLNGGDISTVEQAEPYIQGLPKVKTGDIIEPEHHNAIVDAINALSSVANPSGYKLYDFLKQLCSKDYAPACDWLMMFVFSYLPAFYSTDFNTDNFMSVHNYEYYTGYNYYSDIYVFPHRASNSIGYIGVDDLILESKVYMQRSNTQYCNDPLIYVYNSTRYESSYGTIGVVLSVKLKYAENLSENVPIIEFEYVTGYMSVKLTPDMKIVIEYTDSNYNIITINVDYDVKDRWLFILTDYYGFDLSLYDDGLNRIGHLNYFSQSGAGLTWGEKRLFIYKGYYNESEAKAVFQYDWVAVESNFEFFGRYTPPIK